MARGSNIQPGKMTDKLVRELPPPGTGQRIYFWETEPGGFGVRVTPPTTSAQTGDERPAVRSFVLCYRNKGGTQRRYTIGRFPDVWTVAQARARAKKLKQDIESGADPVQDNREAREAPNIRELMDRFDAEHVETRVKKSTAAEYRRLIDDYIRPNLGAKKVAEITTDDVASLHLKLKDKARTANQMLAVLSKAMNLAERWGYRPQHTNPTRHIQRWPEVKRDRVLTPDEAVAMSEAMATMQGEGTLSVMLATAIQFLFMTGLRKGEMLALRWSDIDFEQGHLKLKDSKTGPATRVVGSTALEILGELDSTTEYVFEGASGEPILWSGLNRAWDKVRVRAGIEDVRLHDLRHSYLTEAGGRFGAFIVRDLGGHKTMQMVSRFVAANQDPVREAADAVSATQAAKMRGKRGQVEHLKPGRSGA